MNRDPIAFVRTEDAPLLPPPPGQTGILGWLWRNMFASMLRFSSPGAAAQSILMMIATVLVGWFAISQIMTMLSFGVFDAVWASQDDEKRIACATISQGGELPDDWYGACYPFISAKWKQLVYGVYPDAELWRVNIVFLLGSIGVAWIVSDAVRPRRMIGLILALFGIGLGYLVTSLYGEAFGERVGVQILLAVGVLFMVLPAEPPRRLISIAMLTVFPLASFVLLTGGGLEIEQTTLYGLVIGAVAAILIGYASRQGMFGAVGDAFGGLFAALGSVLAAAAVVVGVISYDFGLVTVPTDQWGGLLITLVVAITGIVFSLPLGILLALGRRSSLPAVRILSIAFIEFWRGVPLITVLFMSSVMLPFFLPQDVDFNKLIRALIGVMLFSAAYQAEVVRGGLQAIPKGQFEGAMALGLPYWRMMGLIVLPQALTLVIPGIVNTFIGLFKDTTLVLIISIFDLLGQMQTSLTDATWATPVQAPTGYLVVGAIFFLFCFGISRYSLHLERELRKGRNR